MLWKSACVPGSEWLREEKHHWVTCDVGTQGLDLGIRQKNTKLGGLKKHLEVALDLPSTWTPKLNCLTSVEILLDYSPHLQASPQHRDG